VHHVRALGVPHKREALVGTQSSLPSKAIHNIASALDTARDDRGRGGVLYRVAADALEQLAHVGDDGVADYDAEFAVGREVGLGRAASWVGMSLILGLSLMKMKMTYQREFRRPNSHWAHLAGTVLPGHRIRHPFRESVDRSVHGPWH
jgi:hypothetical protein